jgi:hypothetical protein
VTKLHVSNIKRECGKFYINISEQPIDWHMNQFFLKIFKGFLISVLENGEHRVSRVDDLHERFQIYRNHPED